MAFDAAVQPDPDSGPEAAGTEYRTASDTTEWAKQLASGRSVRFVMPSAPSSDGKGTTEWDVAGLGPVDAQAKSVLLDKFQRASGSARLQLQKFLGTMDPTSEMDILREASLRVNVATHEAELACLEKDDYVAVPAGSAVPAEYPGALVFSRNIVESRGSMVDVVFIIEIDKHPAVKQAMKYSKDVYGYYLDTKVMRFNALSLDERARHIHEHDQAIRTLRKGPDAKNLSPMQLRAWSKEYRKKRLHWDWVIDRKRFLVTRRSDQ